jgi:ParB-like chromosome segregation protein Spo0J
MQSLEKQSEVKMDREYMKHCRKNEAVMHNAVANVLWVPIEKVTPNNWNPNSVAKNEMRLLYLSIKSDTYTQPVVTFYNKENDMFEIVDGFHRYTTMRVNKDIYELNGGLLPIVVIDKDVNERMSSTVRHNRARGKHSVNGMANMVFTLLERGMSDEQICKELGLEVEELLRLKHITGFSKLFKDVEFKKSWQTDRQIILRRNYEKRDNRKDGDSATVEDQTLLEERERQL